jgi:hypothetical protein
MTVGIDNSVELAVWIPICLPWSTGANTAERYEVLRLSEEYRVWFDAETAQRFGPVLELDWDMSRLQTVLDQCPELDDSGVSVRLMAHEDADVRALATRRHQMALRRRFERLDPQALDWKSRIAAAIQRENAGRFHCHPLCRPGVALEIQSPEGSTRYIVIGHADAHGDLSIPAITDNEIVMRAMDLMEHRASTGCIHHSYAPRGRSAGMPSLDARPSSTTLNPHVSNGALSMMNTNTRASPPDLKALRRHYEDAKAIDRAFPSRKAKEAVTAAWLALETATITVNGPRKVSGYACRAGKRQAAERRALAQRKR